MQKEVHLLPYLDAIAENKYMKLGKKEAFEIFSEPNKVSFPAQLRFSQTMELRRV